MDARFWTKALKEAERSLMPRPDEPRSMLPRKADAREAGTQVA
jgi:hypothetical protein